MRSIIADEPTKTMKPIRQILTHLMLINVTLLTAGTASADDLVRDFRRALQQLVAQNPPAAKAKSKALAVLVFPDVVRPGSSLALKVAKESFSFTDNLGADTGP